MQRWYWLGGCVLIALLAVGCQRGDGLARVEVRGEVRYRGEPIAKGQIRFTPESDTRGPVTIEPIVAGHYACTRRGGVPVGKHRMAFLSWDPNAPPDGPMQPAPPQYLPAQYNAESEIVWTLDDSSGPVTKDIDLP